MPDYICPLCQQKIDLEEELDEDLEIIGGIPTHGACIIRFYNAQKGEANLSDFERKLAKRSMDDL